MSKKTLENQVSGVIITLSPAAFKELKAAVGVEIWDNPRFNDKRVFYPCCEYGDGSMISLLIDLNGFCVMENCDKKPCVCDPEAGKTCYAHATYTDAEKAAHDGR